MTDEKLINALQLAANAMRRSDPFWCQAHRIEPIDGVEWDQALAAVENALDAMREATPA